jgi:hypothetical protein
MYLKLIYVFYNLLLILSAFNIPDAFQEKKSFYSETDY